MNNNTLSQDTNLKFSENSNIFYDSFFSDNNDINNQRIYNCNKIYCLLKNTQQQIIKDMLINNYIPENILEKISKNNFFKEEETKFLNLNFKNNYIMCILVLLSFLQENLNSLILNEQKLENLEDFIYNFKLFS